jgi:hypothetical protein
MGASYAVWSRMLCKEAEMSVDTGLIVEALRARGHAVGHVIKTPDNAGDYEFEIDGGLLTLEQARALMEADDASVAAA